MKAKKEPTSAHTKAAAAVPKNHPVRVTQVKRTPKNYTDSQFFADVKKASNRIDDLVYQAIEEDEAGSSIKFPS